MLLKKMNKERLNNTWEFLKTKNSHTSKSLLKYAKQNNINEMTFRRDLHLLEKNNFIKLHYGYLEVISSEMDIIENIQKIKINNLDLKEKIALEAINFIDDNDIIFVGPGSTCEQFTIKINKKIDLFITNGINILNKASKNNYIKNTIIVGGKLIDNSNTICGSTAIKQIKDFRFKKIFITAQHIDEEENVYINNFNEYNFINELLQNSEKKYLLVDSSKFNSKGLIKIGNVNLFNKIITY